MKILTRIAVVLLLSMLLVCGVCSAGENDPDPKYWTWVQSTDEMGMFLANVEPIVDVNDYTSITQGVMYVSADKGFIFGKLHFWLDRIREEYRYEHYDVEFYNSFGFMIGKDKGPYDVGTVKKGTIMWKAYQMVWQQKKMFVTKNKR
jgi:hypothetical protein